MGDVDISNISLAIACCSQQITAVYGEDSPEMIRYNQEILSISRRNRVYRP